MAIRSPRLLVVLAQGCAAAHIQPSTAAQGSPYLSTPLARPRLRPPRGNYAVLDPLGLRVESASSTSSQLPQVSVVRTYPRRGGLLAGSPPVVSSVGLLAGSAIASTSATFSSARKKRISGVLRRCRTAQESPDNDSAADTLLRAAKDEGNAFYEWTSFF
ncbi:unnamed protein product [Amoebophrya sp. A25]|nr:unnamed protein product [Amoebophrya sp. A25]|eukprot:GSA25T00024813001.1